MWELWTEEKAESPYAGGIAAYLKDAEYTYYAGMDKNGEVYVTAKDCVFVWGLAERFGEGVMVGDHDGRKFILQVE